MVTPPPTVTPTDAAVAAAEFELREVAVRSNGTVLGPNAQLHSGDRFDMLLEVTGSAYVYVVRVAPGKGLSVLYPTATTAPLSGTVRLPTSPRQIFQLDDQLGVEHLYVVAMARPMSDGISAVTKVIEQLEGTAPDGAPQPPTGPDAGVAPGPTPNPQPTTPPAKKRPRTTTRVASTDVAVDDLRRDVVVVSDDGSVTCADVKPTESGVAACRFTIRHVP